MKVPNTIVAMHLLLVTETFNAEALKNLASTEKSEIRANPTIKRLEAMFNACKKYDKLADDSMLEFFPGHQRCVTDGKNAQNINMLEIAEITANDLADTYCVHSITQCIAQMLSNGYGIDYLDEDELNYAIQDSDIEYIREQLSDAFPTIPYDDLVGIHCDFLNELQKTISCIKRAEHLYIVRPNAFFNSMEEFEDARAHRYSDYARFSLQALGEALAMVCPIWIAAKSGIYNYDFEDFLLDFPIADIVKLYIVDAREAYGDCASADDLLQMLENYTAVFYDPEEEPVRRGNLEGIDAEEQKLNGTIEDIKNDFPAIAKILYEDFYVKNE